MKKGTGLLKVSIIALAVLAVWIFTAPFLAKNLIVEKPLEKADAIMVLSGSSVYIERTQKAAQLYKQGISTKIVLNDDGGRAGWNRAELRNLRFSELAKRELIKQGVAAENIEILAPEVSGTIDEAEALKNFVQANDLRSILLVTSAYHTSRTFWTFERVLEKNGIQIELGIDHAPHSEQTPPPETWWLSVFGWRVVAGEYVKSFVYRLSY